MRDGKNFRRWFRLKRHKSHVVFGVSPVVIGVIGVSSALAEYAKTFTRPVPSIHEGGIAFGPQLAIIEDNRKPEIIFNLEEIQSDKIAHFIKTSEGFVSISDIKAGCRFGSNNKIEDHEP